MRMPEAISGVRRTEKSQLFTEKKHEHEGRKSEMRMPEAISGVRRTEKSQLFTEKKHEHEGRKEQRL